MSHKKENTVHYLYCLKSEQAIMGVNKISHFNTTSQHFFHKFKLIRRNAIFLTLFSFFLSFACHSFYILLRIVLIYIFTEKRLLVYKCLKNPIFLKKILDLKFNFHSFKILTQ